MVVGVGDLINYILFVYLWIWLGVEIWRYPQYHKWFWSDFRRFGIFWYCLDLLPVGKWVAWAPETLCRSLAPTSSGVIGRLLWRYRPGGYRRLVHDIYIHWLRPAPPPRLPLVVILSGIKIPVVASGGMVWYRSLRSFCVPKPHIWCHFGVPWGHFGTLWLHFGGLGLPRGPQGDPLQAKVDFQWILGGFAPPIGVPILVHFRIKI